ncbi:MAG: RNA methyltransferase [Deltaproteobacteria bacterium]|nr:RNA methyltransferase [Candidatus Zymogenaceae bacterium]
MGDLYIGLVHYPVKNKRGDIVASAVTNLDIHDIARIAKTYNVAGFYIIQPMPSQKRLVAWIISHWTEGYGGEYNPIRAEAFDLISLVDAIDDAIAAIGEEAGRPPLVVGTWAGYSGTAIDYERMGAIIKSGVEPVLILLGTGFGMADEVEEVCTYILEPIHGNGGYNHLSVRAAAAIILDRLRGVTQTDRR